MRKEEQVEIILWDWFKTYGKNVVELYFNRKNLVNDRVFKVKGSQEKPDMIISFKDFFNNINYLAIEVKDGRINRNVFDSCKIFGKYYLNYINGKTKYFIDSKEIKINHFAIATQFSKYGKLILKDERIVDNINKGENDVWRKMSVKSETLPRCEYMRTRDFLRNLWSRFREYRNEIKMDIKPSLGIIESDILINFSPSELDFQYGMVGKPILSCMLYKDWIKKPRWQQTLLRI